MWCERGIGIDVKHALKHVSHRIIGNVFEWIIFRGLSSRIARRRSIKKGRKGRKPNGDGILPELFMKKDRKQNQNQNKNKK
jgi:hypothetical protein